MSITLPVRDTDRAVLRSALTRAYIDAEIQAADFFRFSTQRDEADPLHWNQHWRRCARQALERMRVCHDALSL
jgi:hypothetical protein